MGAQKQTAAAIYCRISKDGEGAGAGVRRQENDARALAKRRGWRIADVLVDNDISAYKGKPRPNYRRLLAGLKAGEYDAVIVYHVDRLTRRPAELEEFLDVCDGAGVRALATCTGDIDLSSDDGRFMARILGAAARKESDDKGRRHRSKHAELAHAGQAAGGGRPFGYEKDRVTVRDDEADIIREAARRVLAGDTIWSVCRDLNERGVPGPRGGRLTQNSLRRILLSPRVAGLRALNGEVVADAKWEAIIDRDTHERLRAVIEQRATSGPGGVAARRYLLTGFLRCHRCGTRLIARPQSNRRRTYVCTNDPSKGGCGGLRIVAEPLEALVVEAVMQAVDQQRISRVVRRREREEGEAAEHDLAREIADAEAKLEQLARDFAADLITRREWLAAREGVQQRHDAARRRFAELTHTQALDGLPDAGALRDAWPDLSLDRKRAVLAALISEIVISPAVPGHNRFDPNRVDITWRV